MISCLRVHAESDLPPPYKSKADFDKLIKKYETGFVPALAENGSTFQMRMLNSST